MSLDRYTTAELYAELARRGVTRCVCGPARRELRHQPKGFKEQVGCLVCNRWDSPLELSGEPT